MSATDGGRRAEDGGWRMEGGGMDLCKLLEESES